MILSEQAEQEAALAVEQADHPACFPTQVEWEAWLRLARTTRGTDGSAKWLNYCADCLPEYKAEMQQEGKCAFPRTRFQLVTAHDGDSGIVGFRQERELSPRQRRRRRQMSDLEIVKL